jgi:hypothetical protein
MISTKTTQTGNIHAGAHGTLIQIKLIPPVGAAFDFDLDDATAAAIAFQRPDGSLFNRTLSLPAAILDSEERIIGYVTQSGDTPISGRYEFTLTVDEGLITRIVAPGTFKVLP